MWWLHVSVVACCVRVDARVRAVDASGLQGRNRVLRTGSHAGAYICEYMYLLIPFSINLHEARELAIFKQTKIKYDYVYVWVLL